MLQPPARQQQCEECDRQEERPAQAGILNNSRMSSAPPKVCCQEVDCGEGNQHAAQFSQRPWALQGSPHMHQGAAAPHQDPSYTGWTVVRQMGQAALFWSQGSMQPAWKAWEQAGSSLQAGGGSWAQ